MRLALSVVAASLLLTVTPPGSESQEAAVPERFSGTAVDTSGTVRGSSTAFVTIIANEYTSDAEVQELASVLAEGGQDALRHRLEKLERGRLVVGSRLGYPVAVMRSLPKPDGGRVIRLVTARQILFFESYGGLRTTDYPFGFIQLDLDASGKGTGTAIAAARLKIEDGRLEMESFGIQPLKITKIEKQEK